MDARGIHAVIGYIELRYNVENAFHPWDLANCQESSLLAGFLPESTSYKLSLNTTHNVVPYVTEKQDETKGTICNRDTG